MPPPVRQQVLVDAIALAIPLAQRVLVTCKQQANDTLALMDAVTAARDALASLTHVPPTERPVRSLQLAIVRGGHTLDQVAHLTGIAPKRLQSLVENAPCSRSERIALSCVLLDWSPSTEPSVSRPTGDLTGRHL